MSPFALDEQPEEVIDADHAARLAERGDGWRYELRLESDPPVTYQLGTFYGTPSSVSLKLPLSLSAGQKFQIVAVPLEEGCCH